MLPSTVKKKKSTCKEQVMKINKDYKELVIALSKKPAAIRATLKTSQQSSLDLLLQMQSIVSGMRHENNFYNDLAYHKYHMLIGISGEIGEILDAVKKFVIYQKPADIDNIYEEVGDLIFYLTGYTVFDPPSEPEAEKVNCLHLPYNSINSLWNLLTQFCDANSICMREAVRRNKAKLNKRFSEGTYSDEQAQQRADKQDTAD